MKLYFASSNEHKRDEMSRLIGPCDLILPKDEGLEFSPDENGGTFIENSIIKAKALYEITNGPCLADDSGLIVDALPGLLGVRTARFGCTDGKKLSSKEQCMLLLRMMEGKGNRSARFVCALTLYLSPTRIYTIEESVEGEIAHGMAGDGGFGYDPVFIPRGMGKTTASLSAKEKDSLSHRGKAARMMGKLLEALKC